jgi:hypothetical protein
MKTGLTKLSIFLACGLAFGLAFTLGRASAPSSKKKHWVSLSKMFFGTRTEAGLVIPTVNVIVSNTGPQKVWFALGWFECRKKGDGAWLGIGKTWMAPYPMHGLTPLSPGSSITMPMDIKGTDKPQDRMAFCAVTWVEREYEVSPIDQLMSRACNSVNLNWRLRFTDSVTEHHAYSANTHDYFYEMYWHRTNWSSINTNFPHRVQGFQADPGTDEWNALNTLIVFEQFCREGL